jgi:hypothetical protein
MKRLNIGNPIGDASGSYVKLRAERGLGGRPGGLPWGLPHDEIAGGSTRFS